MGARPQPQPTLYEQLEALPEGLTGEILNGQLYTQPRPSGPHGFTSSSLGYDLIGPFQRGRGGPGGWWIIDEPELHFISNTEVDVPDLAGWRRTRLPRAMIITPASFLGARASGPRAGGTPALPGRAPGGIMIEALPRIPKDHRYEVVPDWVCEVLSPSTESKDREVKMPIYAQFGVAYAWLIDPRAHTLEAYALEGGTWREIGRFAGGARVSVAPFEAVTIGLDDLWAPT